MFRPDWNGNFIRVEVAFQRHHQPFNNTILRSPVHILPQPVFRVVNTQMFNLQILLDLVSCQRFNQHYNNEVMTVAVFSNSFNILMFLLYHQTILLSQTFTLKEDLLVDPVFDGGASWEGLKLG